LSHTDSLNKNSKQIAIAKAFTNSFCFTMVFGKLPKTPATVSGDATFSKDNLFVSYLQFVV